MHCFMATINIHVGRKLEEFGGKGGSVGLSPEKF